MKSNHELDDRKMKILQTIIKTYLETGDPVGSRTISKYTDLNLSSATIRNEMAGTIRGTGKTIPPMAIILFSLCIYRVLWVQFVVPHFDSIRGVYIAYPISWAIGAALMVLYAWKGKWIPGKEG